VEGNFALLKKSSPGSLNSAIRKATLDIGWLAMLAKKHRFEIRRWHSTCGFTCTEGAR
jgi:hypothetical protein